MARLLTLGRFELRDGGANGGEGDGGLIGMQPKRLALLAYLALAAPRGPQRRDTLLSLFWPESTTEEGRNALRQALHHIRQQLGEGVIVSGADDRVGLAPEVLSCDALELERAVASGNDALAVSLHAAPFLHAVFIRGVSTDFEAWADRERVRLRDLAAEAARRLAAAAWSAGQVEAAVAAARSRNAIAPLNEGALRDLLAMLDDAGRASEALGVAERFREQLWTEHELEWSPETAALVAAIQGGTRERRDVRAPERRDAPAVRSRVASVGVPEHAPPVARRRSWMPVAAGVLLAALLGGAAWLNGADPASAPATSDAAVVRRILVNDFVDRTPARSLGALVASAIRVDLGQSSTLRVLTTAQVSAALQLLRQPLEVSLDDSLAREVAIREGATAFVTGEVFEVAGDVVLAARIVAAPSGDELAAARETARDSADILPAIERLSRTLRQRIGEELTQLQRSEPLTRVTTTSLEALQRYTEGLRQLDLGNRASGVQLLEQAVAIDTGFATAHRMLGTTYSALGEPALARASLRRAFDNRQRLPFKERYLVMGSYHRNATGDYAAAADAYRRLLALYPDDKAALNNLGLTLTSFGEYAAAESLFRKVITQDSTLVNVRLVLAEALAMQGRQGEANAVLAEAARRFPGHEVLALTRIYIPSAASDWPVALERARERLARVTSTMLRIDALQTLGEIELVTGRLRSGTDRLRESLRLADRESSDWKYLWSAAMLASAELRFRGDTASARRQLRDALARIERRSIADDEVPAPQLASALVAAGMVREARALLRTVGEHPTRPSDVAARQYLVGLLAMGEGRWNEAVDSLRAATSVGSECPICGVAELAAAEEGAGRARESIAAAERYLATPHIHRFESDAVYLLETLQRVERLKEAMGDHAGAQAARARLMELWRGADAELVARIGGSSTAMSKSSRR